MHRGSLVSLMEKVASVSASIEIRLFGGHKGGRYCQSFRSTNTVIIDLCSTSWFSFFGCGTVRPKGPNSSVWTFAVSGVRTLEEQVVPFFERHPLRVKDQDFQTFAVIVRSLRRKEHLDADGFERVARLAYGMNAHGKQRARSLEVVLAGSSETARQATLLF